MWIGKDNSILTAKDLVLSTDERVQVRYEADMGVWMLSIDPVRASDGGLYICYVFNGIGEEYNKTFTLQVIGKNIIYNN